MPPSIDLDALFESLDGPDARRRPRAEAIVVEATAPLTPEDFAEREHAEGIARAQPLAKLRASHHNLARLLAQGYSPAECSVLTHYETSRIYVLQGDPLFRELVDHYRSELRTREADVVGMLQSVALDAVQEFRERLESNPEGISNKDLISAAKLGLDRSGYGPTSTHLVGEATLSEADRRALLERARANANVVLGVAHKGVLHESNSHGEVNAGELLAPLDPEAGLGVDDAPASGGDAVSGSGVSEASSGLPAPRG